MEFGNYEKNVRGVFLLSSKETDMNCISFTIALGKLGEKKECTEEANSDTALSKVLQHAVPIYPDMDNVYEITFEDYILHQTRNESYTSYDKYEIRKGNPLLIFEKSRLLDFLSQITDCTSYPDGTFYPEKWIHYGIYCEDHIIDVISCSKPKIRKLQH